VYYATLKPLCRLTAGALFRYRALGRGNVPPAGPVLLAANHASFLDPPLVGIGTSRRLHFLAKAELFRVPLLGGLIRRLNAHPVERDGADLGALRQALALLRHGEALLVFPEGTRGPGTELGPGKPGAGMLAAVSEAPVVPVYIDGSGRAWPRGARGPRLVRITVTFGEAMQFTRVRGKARYQVISDEIMAAVGRLKADVREASMPVAARSVTSHVDGTAHGPLPVGHSQSTGGTQEWTT
jgi:1-acyl-sn-glycerol-3-phosphate acyltransferase